MKKNLLHFLWISSVLFSVSALAQTGPGTALSVQSNAAQYVTANIPTLSSNYTISAWVFLRSGGNWWGTRLCVLGGSNTVEVLVRSATSNDYDPQYLELGRWGVFNGQPSTVPVPTNEWVHLAVVVSETKQISYFINGAEAGNWDGAGYDLSLGTTNILLGDNAIRRFDGVLDEVRIWNTARSQGEIQADMSRRLAGTEAGLLAYWRFDEASGAVASNSAAATGAACDGTLVNGPARVLSGIPFVPDPATLSAADIGRTNATLRASIHPGNLPTAAWFEWGETTNYGNATAAADLPATNTALAAEAALTGLTPGMTYYYRAAASNSAGIAYGGQQSFACSLTPPAAVTLPATGITASNATLVATVNPNGLPAAAWFEWGETTNYGNATAVTNLPATNTALAVQATITGLAPNAAYHFRVATTNADGASAGANQSFATPRLPGTNWVTTLADSGPGSLRQVLLEAMAGDTIAFTVTGVVALTSGELAITNSLTISGPGAANLAISGNNAGRVFNISSNAVVAISDLTIRDGKAADGAAGGTGQPGGVGSNGGGIYNAGNLTLIRCVVRNNAAGNGGLGGSGNAGGYAGAGGAGGSGGGLYNAGTLTLSACTISANAAGNGGLGGTGTAGGGGTGGDGGAGGAGGGGGGVYNAGTLTLSACTISANAGGTGGTGGVGGAGGGGTSGDGGAGGAGGGGGGLYNAGTLTLSACTFSANADGNGGNGGAGAASNGTFGGNGGSGGAGGWGGGVLSTVGASQALVRNTILAFNAAGAGGAGGNRGAGNPMGIVGSAGGPGGDPDISGAFTSLGHNFIRLTGSAVGFRSGVNGDILGSFDPRLGPLADNGGPTPTIALLPGSPALDAGDDTLTGTDQRGMPRKAGEHVDIGAYEMSAADAAAYGSAPSLGAVSCAVSNLPSGVSAAVFTFSVNPNGLDTAAWIEYGVTPGYGGASRALALGYTNVSVATNITVTGLAPGMTYRYRLRAQNLAGTAAGPEQTFTTTPAGDLDGDGAVSSAEMNAIGLNFWDGTANYITNLTDAGGGRFTFGLGSDVGLDIRILASTNLVEGNWQMLTNAAGFYFYDPDATNYPLRYYRLMWP